MYSIFFLTQNVLHWSGGTQLNMMFHRGYSTEKRLRATALVFRVFFPDFESTEGVLESCKGDVPPVPCWEVNKVTGSFRPPVGDLVGKESLQKGFVSNGQTSTELFLLIYFTGKWLFFTSFYTYVDDWGLYLEEDICSRLCLDVWWLKIFKEVPSENMYLIVFNEINLCKRVKYESLNI